MFQQIRRLLKHSAVYGMGHILTRMVSFILLPYLTHALNPEEYGAVTLLYTFIALALVLYAYGFDVTFLRYYILENDNQQRKKIFSTIFWSATITSTLFSIIIAFSAAWLVSLVFENPESLGISSSYLILLSGALLFVETLGIYPYLWLRAVEKSLPFMALKTTGVAINIGLAILLISVFDRGIAGVIEANFIAASLQLLFLLPSILKNLTFSIQFDKLKEYLTFGFPNVPSQLFVMVIELANRKILEVILGLSIVGIFSVGYKLGLFMAVVTMGFRFAWQPFFLSIADTEEAKQTFSRVFTYFCLVTCSIFLLLVFTIKPIMTTSWPVVGILINPDYWEGLNVFPIILLAHICNGAYANFMVGVYLKKKTGLMPIATGIAAAINIGGNILLIPIYGMMAAAWMTLISYFSLAVLLYFLIRPYYRVDYEWKRVLLIAICTAVIYAVSMLPFFQTFWLLKLILIPLFLTMLWLLRFFLPEEISAVTRRLSPTK
ncbi:MAG: oligosaccharide flippase family protein [bacterium]